MAKLALLGFVVFISLAAVVLFHSISPYLTPSQILSMGEAKNVKVIGKAKEVSINGSSTIFKITDGTAEILAVYSGILEFTSEEIVAVGDWNGNFLIAKEILQKCHTEYGG